MQEANAGMGITGAAFDRVAIHLEAALRENGVDEANTEAILAEVGALRTDVVEQ